jgi:hypothetical protein
MRSTNHVRHFDLAAEGFDFFIGDAAEPRLGGRQRIAARVSGLIRSVNYDEKYKSTNDNQQ